MGIDQAVVSNIQALRCKWFIIHRRASKRAWGGLSDSSTRAAQRNGYDIPSSWARAAGLNRVAGRPPIAAAERGGGFPAVTADLPARRGLPETGAKTGASPWLLQLIYLILLVIFPNDGAAKRTRTSTVLPASTSS